MDTLRLLNLRPWCIHWIGLWQIRHCRVHAIDAIKRHAEYRWL